MGHPFRQPRCGAARLRSPAGEALILENHSKANAPEYGRSGRRWVREEASDRLQLQFPFRFAAVGRILLVLALGALLVTLVVSRIALIFLVIFGWSGLWLSTTTRSVTIDGSGQRVLFVVGYLRLLKKTRVVRFDEIAQVYLDHEERPAATLRIRSGRDERLRKRWMIFLALRDGNTLTLADATSTEPAGETVRQATQVAYWEALAQSICALTGKTLVRSPSVPGRPHAFVEAIDQILQQNLAQSELSGRAVELRSQAAGGLEIVIDGQVYQALDDVDDSLVRDLIRSAIDAWQEGQSSSAPPGLR